MNRKDLSSSKEFSNTNQVPLVITHHRTLPNMSKIITENLQKDYTVLLTRKNYMNNATDKYFRYN